MKMRFRKRFVLPESEILATEATHRLKAGTLARIFLMFFCCAAVLAAQQRRREASAKTGFKANGWSVVWNRDSPSSRGGAVATGELTNRAKDTFNIVPRRHHLSWCNFRDQRETRRKLERGSLEHQQRVERSLQQQQQHQEGHGRSQGSGPLKHNKVMCFLFHASLRTSPGGRGTLQTDFFQLQFGVGHSTDAVCCSLYRSLRLQQAQL